jgi:hypothetical protein
MLKKWQIIMAISLKNDQKLCYLNRYKDAWLTV